MTELIDLATLASLGQHFSTLEESSEMKTTMLKLQTDMEVIKSFLSKLYGTEFSSLFGHEVEEMPVSQVKAVRKPGNGEQGRKLTMKMKAAPRPPPQLQQRPTPPPLQRFNLSRNGNQSAVKRSSGVGGGRGNASTTVAVGEQKVEKFHRNFLSIRSLKSASSPFKNGVGNGSLSISRVPGILKKPTGNGNYRVKTEEPEVQRIEEESSSFKYETEYPTEETGFGDEENYNDVDESESGVMEDFDYYEAPKYEENGDYEEEETEENAMGQVEYQEYDDTIYEEENYEANDLELIDMNNSAYLEQNEDSLAGGQEQGPGTKKAAGRRVSFPAASSSSAAFANDGSNDSFQKKCKVCHEEVPSYTLFNHVIHTHYQGEVPTCNICKKTFTYRQGLISHMRYHDAGKYDKACSYCGKRFIRRSDVIIHERRLHTGERPYQCPVPNCNQGFVRRYCLITHCKTNHGEPFLSQIMAQTSNRRKSS